MLIAIAAALFCYVEMMSVADTACRWRHVASVTPHACCDALLIDATLRAPYMPHVIDDDASVMPREAQRDARAQCYIAVRAAVRAESVASLAMPPVARLRRHDACARRRTSATLRMVR